MYCFQLLPQHFIIGDDWNFLSGYSLGCNILQDEMLCPHLEYASSVWNPFRKCHINALEMVQRKAARFATSNYTRKPGTVTTIQNLGWQTLENRRKRARLTVYICFCRPSLKLSTDGDRMTSGGRLFQSLIVLGMKLYL
jgi:hypothetical protein